jgi:predicted transcriptional regulator
MKQQRAVVTNPKRELIQALLKREGVTQREIAESWGITQAAVSKLLTREGSLSYERLVDLARHCKMPAETLADVEFIGTCSQCPHCRAAAA